MDINTKKLKKNAFRVTKHRGITASRIRVPGGHLNAKYLGLIQEIAETYGNGTVHLTTRQGFEVPGIDMKNMDKVNELLQPIIEGLEINQSDVMIFHTHTCESYTPTENFAYEESGTFRTTDLDYSVVRVGNSLTDQLTSYGFNVVHDKTYHDYPAYSGSYGRSMATVENLLISHPNTDIIIDLHRDAIADTSYAPSIKIGDEVVSQLMFVIGTDGGGLEHPNWQKNLQFAVKVQKKANELYPGLFRPILLRNSRYNQQLGKAACIIEVGATGNTLEQSMASMKYLARVFSSIFD